jgi:hypothetical protein
LPVVGASSSCQWPEGRGDFVKFNRDPATSDFVKTAVVHDARTDPYIQSDFSRPFTKSSHENQRLAFEINIANLFNQHAAVGFQQVPMPGYRCDQPSRPSRFPGDPKTNWGLLMNGNNYVEMGRGHSPAFSPSPWPAVTDCRRCFSLHA